MAFLCVNVDHVATVRQARKERVPDPLEAARLAEKGGAVGITVHLREDRRHIQDEDVRRLRKSVQGKLNLEMAASAEIVKIACRVEPEEATLVPEKRLELTTEGGLDVVAAGMTLKKAIAQLKKAGIVVSLFIDPDKKQVEAAAQSGADVVELHTGTYAQSFGRKGRSGAAKELSRLKAAAELAHSLGLRVNAGHGLTYQNVAPVARLPYMEDLNIGHNIVARAVMVGMEKAVREMLAAMRGK